MTLIPRILKDGEFVLVSSYECENFSKVFNKNIEDCDVEEFKEKILVFRI